MRSKMSFEKIRETAFQFIMETVSRYSNQIHIWRVISGLNVFNYFGFNFEQILEITRAATMAVKAGSDVATRLATLDGR